MTSVLDTLEALIEKSNPDACLCGTHQVRLRSEEAEALIRVARAAERLSEELPGGGPHGLYGEALMEFDAALVALNGSEAT